MLRKRRGASKILFINWMSKRFQKLLNSSF
jgi:hypothetical protein